MKTDELFLNDDSIAIRMIRKHEYPYTVLSNIKDYIIKIGNELDDSYELKGENIWIHKTAKIADNVSLAGTCIIDKEAKIRPSAYIRGAAIIGKYCVLGNSCEIKNSIMFDYSKAPHFNHIGDSILGAYAHMGLEA